MRWSWVLAVAAVIGGCGPGAQAERPSSAPTPTAPSGDAAPQGDVAGAQPAGGDAGGGGSPGDVQPEAPPPPCDGRVQIRLNGVDAVNPDVGFDLRAFRARLAALTATDARGGALPVTGLQRASMDLLADGAWLVGYVPFPGPDGLVTISISLREAWVGTASTLGMLDGCEAPIVFRYDPRRVDPQRCHVVASLDLQRSLASRTPGAIERGVAILPTFTIHY